MHCVDFSRHSQAWTNVLQFVLKLKAIRSWNACVIFIFDLLSGKVKLAVPNKWKHSSVPWFSSHKLRRLQIFGAVWHFNEVDDLSDSDFYWMHANWRVSVLIVLLKSVSKFLHHTDINVLIYSMDQIQRNSISINVKFHPQILPFMDFLGYFYRHHCVKTFLSPINE
jgi:hypothetical protein